MNLYNISVIESFFSDFTNALRNNNYLIVSQILFQNTLFNYKIRVRFWPFTKSIPVSMLAREYIIYHGVFHLFDFITKHSPEVVKLR